MAGLKLFLDPKERRQIGAPAVRLANRVGVEIADSPEGCAMLPLTDLGAREFARRFPDRYLPADAFHRLVDRLHMPELGIPHVSSSLDPNAFDGPVFVKQRRTLKSGPHRLAYTNWPSAKEFIALHGVEFLEFNASPELLGGELIFQPAWGYDSGGLEVSFSVNSSSEIKVLMACAMSSEASQKFSRIATTEPPKAVVDSLQKVCQEQGIRSGIHSVEFVASGSEFLLFDWNCRPFQYAIGLFLGHPGYADAALAHMCNIEAPNSITPYFEQRGYFSRPIDTKWYGHILGSGMLPRLGAGGIVRVGAMAESPAEVSARLVQMESLCAY